MAMATVNGVELYHELTGSGDVPLVLVHGSWVSHQTWGQVVPQLEDSFRVLRYDRRGHSGSDRPSGQGSVHDDVADLAALIEQLDLAPAWVAGNSFGGSIALRLAAERPELLLGITAHEPPLFALLDGDPALAPMLEGSVHTVAAVAERIASGDHAGAAEEFVETMLGPGTWARFSPEGQAIMVENAPTFLDEASDPDQLTFDVDWISDFPRPALLTHGDQSPPPFVAMVRKLAEALPAADIRTFAGAGHVPHMTHPESYVETLDSFARRHMT